MLLNCKLFFSPFDLQNYFMHIFWWYCFYFCFVQLPIISYYAFFFFFLVLVLILNSHLILLKWKFIVIIGVSLKRNKHNAIIIMIIILIFKGIFLLYIIFIYLIKIYVYCQNIKPKTKNKDCKNKISQVYEFYICSFDLICFVGWNILNNKQRNQMCKYIRTFLQRPLKFAIS